MPQEKYYLNLLNTKGTEREWRGAAWEFGLMDFDCYELSCIYQLLIHLLSTPKFQNQMALF